MQNLLTGVCLIALAALAAAVILFGGLTSFDPAPMPPDIETSSVDPDGAVVEAVVGYDRNPALRPSEAAGASFDQRLEDAGGEIVKPPGRDRILTVRARRGDSLGSLARVHLGDVNLWRAIWEANPELARPEDLREGQEVRIPLREGR